MLPCNLSLYVFLISFYIFADTGSHKQTDFKHIIESSENPEENLNSYPSHVERKIELRFTPAKWNFDRIS